jgi:hypothetical protein
MLTGINETNLPPASRFNRMDIEIVVTTACGNSSFRRLKMSATMRPNSEVGRWDHPPLIHEVDKAYLLPVDSWMMSARHDGESRSE